MAEMSPEEERKVLIAIGKIKPEEGEERPKTLREIAESQKEGKPVLSDIPPSYMSSARRVPRYSERDKEIARKALEPKESTRYTDEDREIARQQVEGVGLEYEEPHNVPTVDDSRLKASTNKLKRIDEEQIATIRKTQEKLDENQVDRELAYAEKSKHQHEYAKQMKREAEDTQEEWEKCAADIENWREQAEKMQMDPQRIFKRQDGSTNYGKRILAAISVAVGAWGTGGQNLGLRIIDNAIKQDIKAQEENFNRKRALAADRLSQYGAFRAMKHDKKVAIEASHIAMIQDCIDKVKVIKASTDNIQTKQNLDNLISGLERNSEQHTFQAAQAMYNAKQAENEQWRHAQVEGLDFISKVPPSKQDRTAAQKIMADTVATQKKVKVYLDYVGKYGTSRIPIGAERNMAETLYSDAFVAMKDLKNMGANLSAGESRLINRLVPPPSMFQKSAENTAATLANTHRSLCDDANSKIRVYGYTLGDSFIEASAGEALGRGD